MDLLPFLEWLATSAGAGAFVFMIIDYIRPLYMLEGKVKLIMAMALSLVVPPSAYWARIALGVDVFSAEGLFGAVAVAFITSKIVHDRIGQERGAQ
jgi:hypothetical protein